MSGQLHGTRRRPDTYLDVAEETTAEMGQEFHSTVEDAFSHADDGHIQRISAFNIQYPLTDRLLYKVDHATMAHSLEARVPFLDHELAEFAFRIPDRFKRESGYKPILNRAVSDLLPERTRTRTKHGFGVPTGRWFREGHEAIERYLAEERVAATPYLDAEHVQNEWAAHRRDTKDASMYLWRCLNYVAWYHQIVCD